VTTSALHFSALMVTSSPLGVGAFLEDDDEEEEDSCDEEDAAATTDDVVTVDDFVCVAPVDTLLLPMPLPSELCLELRRSDPSSFPAPEFLRFIRHYAPTGHSIGL
jgi:hypothetical protein